MQNDPTPLIEASAESFSDVDSADLDPLIERIGDARVVLIGEATHGTSEIYRIRQRITQELIQRAGFIIVAVEADWPDAERVDEYVRERPGKPERVWDAFSRFSTWMWRNHEILPFVEWLRNYNAGLVDENQKAGFLWSRSLQPLYVHTRGAPLPGADRSVAGTHRGVALRLPGAVRGRSRTLWARRPDGSPPRMRGGRHARAHRSPAASVGVHLP